MAEIQQNVAGKEDVSEREKLPVNRAELNETDQANHLDAEPSNSSGKIEHESIDSVVAQPLNDTIPNDLQAPIVATEKCREIQEESFAVDVGKENMTSNDILLIPSVPSVDTVATLWPTCPQPIMDEAIRDDLVLATPMIPLTQRNPTRNRSRSVPNLLPICDLIDLFDSAAVNEETKAKSTKTSQRILGFLDNYSVLQQLGVSPSTRRDENQLAQEDEGPSTSVSISPRFYSDMNFGQLFYSDESD